MDTPVLVALIAAGGTLSAALIAALLNKGRKPVIQRTDLSPHQPSLSDSTLRKTETETIRIVIRILNTGQTHEVEVPVDMQVSILVESLCKRLNIPPINYGDIGLPWQLYSVKRHVVLDGNLSLKDNAVQEMEVLGFHKELFGG